MDVLPRLGPAFIAPAPSVPETLSALTVATPSNGPTWTIPHTQTPALNVHRVS
jgi:hypothetical protein